MKYLPLLLLISCASSPTEKYDYIMDHAYQTYRCDRYERSAYGAAGLDCARLSDGKKLSRIINPETVYQVKEEN